MNEEEIVTTKKMRKSLKFVQYLLRSNTGDDVFTTNIKVENSIFSIYKLEKILQV